MPQDNQMEYRRPGKLYPRVIAIQSYAARTSFRLIGIQADGVATRRASVVYIRRLLLYLIMDSFRSYRFPLWAASSMDTNLVYYLNS